MRLLASWDAHLSKLGGSSMSLISSSVTTYEFNATDSRKVSGLVEQLIASYSSFQDRAFLEASIDLARLLPEGIIRFLRSFQQREPAVAAVVRGLAIDEERIGATPEHWSAHGDPARTIREDLYFLLLGSLIGE